jgi:hypothetical protein
VKKGRTEFLAFLRYVRSLHLLGPHRRRARQLQPHLSTKADARVGEWTAQALLIRRYIAWRNRHAQDRMLREVVERADVA